MPTPSIQLVFNGQVLQNVPFHKDTLSIGRMRENDVVIDNLAVSRFHAKMTLLNGEVYLEDQGSENGTFVNGEPIQKKLVTAKDEIVIGKHQIILAPSSLETTPSLNALGLFGEDLAADKPPSS